MAAAPNQQQLSPASSRTENQAIQDSWLLSFAVLSLQRGGRCQSPALYSTPSALTGTLGCGGDGRCSPSGWASCRSRPYCDSCDPQEKYSQKSFRSCFSIRLNSRHWHKPKAQQRPLVLLAVWKGNPISMKWQKKIYHMTNSKSQLIDHITQPSNFCRLAINSENTHRYYIVLQAVVLLH